MNPRKQPTGRGRCEHATFPVEVLTVGGKKKIAHCLGCGRSGPSREGSVEALAALRGTPRPGFVGPIPAAREPAASDGKGQPTLGFVRPNTRTKPSANFAPRGFSEVHPEDGPPGRYLAGTAAPETATLKAAPSGIRAPSSL